MNSILELYASGQSINKISKITGISPYHITKILKDSNIDIRVGNYQELKLNTDEINRLYDSGMSTYDIAKVMGCSDETIRKKVKLMRSISDRNKLDAEAISIIRQKSLKNWKNPSYVQKVKNATSRPEYRQVLAMNAKKNYRLSLGAWIKSERARVVLSDRAKRMWRNEGYRTRMQAFLSTRMGDLIEASRRSLAVPSKRAAWIEKIRANNTKLRAKSPNISSTQRQLYYILSDSEISYKEEGEGTQIGPFYVVDCVIEKQQKMTRPLIIEVNGEYWHQLDRVIVKDRQKATYIRRHTDYDLLKLDEIELKSFDAVSSKLAEFGLLLRKREFNVKDVVIERITETDAKMFYSVFHYSCSIRKGAIAYGAYVNGVLVAAISYCHPIRPEAATRLDLLPRQVMEISRYARMTNADCKNLGSYIISKTIKLLPTHIKCVISYSDSTYGHTGGLYKAANFTFDGDIAPDYHYRSEFGIFHKKSIWDQAKKMKMTEAEYAIKHGMDKIYGESKSRWLFYR